MEAPSVVLAGSPPMVYVAEPVWNATWGRWLGWHAPTLVFSLGLLTVLVSCWWVRRVSMRPRQAGRMYCRGCNHQLTKPQLKLNEKKRAVWADDEARCPECGQRHLRGPVRGRLRSTRVLPVLLAAPVILAVCAVAMLATLQFHRGGAWASGTWPVLGMEKAFGSWALERRIPPMLMQSAQLWRIDPRTNEVEDIGPANAMFFGMREFVSPDGNFLVLAIENSRAILVIDLKDKSRRVYPREGADLRVYSLQRFSEDGKRVFLTRSWYKKSGVRQDDLLEFDPQSGAFKELGTVQFPQDDGILGRFSTPQFVFAETPSGVVWVHNQNVRNATGKNEFSTLRWEVDGKEMERKEESATGSLRIGLSADGNAVVVADFIAGTSRAFTLATGELLQSIPALGADGDRDRSGARRIQFSGNATIPVMALKGNGGEVGRLKISKQCWPCGSEDGRIACGWIERDVAPSWIGAMLGVPPTQAPVVRVWDFEKLLDPKTELPIRAPDVKSSAP